MRVSKCRDAGFDCGAMVRPDSEEEVLRQVAEHARGVHDVEVTPEMVEQVKAVIRDEA